MKRCCWWNPCCRTLLKLPRVLPPPPWGRAANNNTTNIHSHKQNDDKRGCGIRSSFPLQGAQQEYRVSSRDSHPQNVIANNRGEPCRCVLRPRRALPPVTAATLRCPVRQRLYWDDRATERPKAGKLAIASFFFALFFLFSLFPAPPNTHTRLLPHSLPPSFSSALATGL